MKDKDRLKNQQDRAKQINELISFIASCGRKFFSIKIESGSGDGVERFEWSGKKWYFVDWKNDRHYLGDPRSLRKVTHGGTLRLLLRDMLQYIRSEKADSGIVTRHLGPWEIWYCGGDLWGYGEDMEKVRKKAAELFGVK